MANNLAIKKQIKFAVVMYGGGSLAIYINGVAQELLRLTQATADGTVNSSGTTAIYRKIALFLADDKLQQDCTNKIKKPEEINECLTSRLSNTPSVKFVIDVLTGSSAGGINAVFLAKAMVNGAANMDDLQKLWLEQGDFAKLLNDKKSVADNSLDAPPEPASLLNSQRMYLELLKALDGMDDRQPNGFTPKVEPLDLFVTYTDFAGLPTNLVLSDKTVLELTHKRVFNFRNDGAAKDFNKENNPFLAFAARCTSSFPVAFEPMRLKDIDDVLDSEPPRTENGKSDNPAWLKYFGNATDENGKPIVWETRSFVDGGCLDNKPFGFAIDKLAQRADDGIVERKLLYIEPSPEDFKALKNKDGKPDALQNLYGQASGLPRYETIREDLRRVLDRNRLIERVARLTAEVEGDFEKNPAWLVNMPLSTTDWSRADLNDVASIKGAAFIPYYRLRVSATTDDIARLVTKFFKIDDDSDYFKVLRCLIRTWREQNYHEYKTDPEDDKTFNKFLYDFDVEYRLRRLRFVLQKAEYMLRCKTQVLKIIIDFGETEPQTEETDSATYTKQIKAADKMVKNNQGVLSPQSAILHALPGDTEKEKIAFAEQFDESNYVTAVAQIQKVLNGIYLQLRRDNDYLRENLSNSATGKNPADTAENVRGADKFRSELKNVDDQLCTLEREKQRRENEAKKLTELNEGSSSISVKQKSEPELEDEKAKLSLSALNRILTEISRQKRSECDGISKADGQQILEAAYPDQEIEPLLSILKLAAEALNTDVFNQPEAFLRRASLQAKALLGIENNRGASVAQMVGDKAISTETLNLLNDAKFDDSTAEAQFVQNYLRNYYELFDSYDQISFPIYFESPVGEAVPVDVVRISSRDAHSLINEELAAEKRRKLAGDYLFAFGAFLDPRWRLNDIMWGRLDGAERLITTLLPEEKFGGLRDILIREANETILHDILLKRASQGFQDSIVGALTLAANESLEQISAQKAGDKVFDNFLANLSKTNFTPHLTTTLTAALGKDAVCDYLTADYEVNRRLEPQPTLQMISRATQIGGKILQNIAEKQAQAGSRLSWIARLGQVFWGLVTVAAPNSLANLLFVYWVQLLFLFEVVVIAGATLLSQPNAQQFGIVAFVITLVIYLSVTALHDEMLGSSAWKRWLRFLLGATLTIFVLSGVLLLYGLFVDEQTWERLARLRDLIACTDFVRWQKLFLPAPFVVITLLALLWREIEKLNLAVVGRAIIGGFLAIVGFSLYFNRLTTGAIFGHAPLIKLEFVANAEVLQTLITGFGDHCTGVKTALWFDTLVFVPFYLAFLLVLSALLGQRRQKWAFYTSIAAAVCAITAALADWTENYYSLVALGMKPADISDQTAALISVPAHLKWTLIFVALGILATVFLRTKENRLWNIVTIVMVVVSFSGISGTFYFPGANLDHPLVMMALISAFLGWLISGILFQFESLRNNFKCRY